MYESTKLSLRKMIDVNTPIIYINDYDYARIDSFISQVIKCPIDEWNPATNRTAFDTKEPKSAKLSLVEFLENAYTVEPLEPHERFLLLRDVHDMISDPVIKSLLGLIAQRKLYDRMFETSIILVSPILVIPQEIDKYVSVLEIEYPNENAIVELIYQHIEENKYQHNKETFEKNELPKLVKTLKGMSPFEIDRMLDMAMSSNGSLSSEDCEMIISHKKQIVKRSGILELIDSPETIESIGGLTGLIEYLNLKKIVFDNLSEAKQFEINVPKGIFLVGMPGCGKSLSAKATASLFKVPLLKMDIGSMMKRYQGESEADLRKAIKIAEAASPCVLWIDEIEKMFSRMDENGGSVTRMFGYFLSWLQDKKSPVYVIATANNVERIPPELKRKGRFDEIFCVNLPNKEERKQIFKVHLSKKQGKTKGADGKIIEADNFNISSIVNNERSLEVLAELTEGFSGADIESLVNDAVETCFLNRIAKRGDNLTLDLLKIIISTTKPISETCGEQISKMKAEFEKNDFRNASLSQIR